MSNNPPTNLDKFFQLALQQAGVALPQRPTLNVLGAGAPTLADDPVNNVTTATFPAPSVGWQTALDLDFTSLPNQTIGSDGSVTIGGKTWTKSQTSGEHAATAIVNGTGLVMQPAGGTDFYHSGSPNAPSLFLPFSQMGITGIDWTTKFRLWLYVSAFANSSSTLAAGDWLNAVLGVADLNNATNPLCHAVLQRGGQYFGGSPGFQLDPIFSNNSAGKVTDMSSTGLVAANDVMLLEWTLGSYTVEGFAGQYASGWPAQGAMRILNTAVYSGSGRFGDDVVAVPNMTGAGVSICAQHNTSDSNYVTATIARMRVDYRY